MSDDSHNWSPDAAKQLRKFVAAIEDPSFAAARWPTKEELTRPDGVMQMPYPEYSPLVGELWKFLFEHRFHRHPYELLPEDPPDAKPGLDTHLILRNVEDISQASIHQISRYFALCHRAERFADGHIDDEFRRGRMSAALRRTLALMGDG